MNHSNIIIIISTALIATIFLGSVFLNLNIKNSKEEIKTIKKEISVIKKDLKRQQIEITVLTNPHNILDFIKKNDYKPVPRENIDVIYLKE